MLDSGTSIEWKARKEMKFTKDDSQPDPRITEKAQKLDRQAVISARVPVSRDIGVRPLILVELQPDIWMGKCEGSPRRSFCSHHNPLH
mmetsp:Transcript_8360/g.30914  ORF Transcript_8360/g.30914 Transcript_8360/m.30914 type:complete len:88 (-) Transcript_8360:1711-1974(-)